MITKIRLYKDRDVSAFYSWLGMASAAGAALEFVEGPVVRSEPSVYWKIGLTMPDVDKFKKGAQFEDVAYVAHVRDPCGHVVELLQAPQFCLGQVTLRVRDIDKSLTFYQGLGLNVIYTHKCTGFTLYFLALTDEQGDRDWCWTRPYTTLELQAYDEPRELAPPTTLHSIVIQNGEKRTIKDPDGVLIELI